MNDFIETCWILASWAMIALGYVAVIFLLMSISEFF